MEQIISTKERWNKSPIHQITFNLPDELYKKILERQTITKESLGAIIIDAIKNGLTNLID